MNHNDVIADALTHMELTVRNLEQLLASSAQANTLTAGAPPFVNEISAKVADAIKTFDSLGTKVRAELALPRFLDSELNRRVRGKLLSLERDFRMLKLDDHQAHGRS